MFTDNISETMKYNENPKKYMDDFLAKVKREKLGYQDIQARASLLPYAPFICEGCGKLYIRDQAIVQQGMCDCHSKIIANAECQNFEEPKDGEVYECLKCGENSNLNTIEANENQCPGCHEKHFVKASLLEKVMENTRDISLSEKKPLIDVWKENGGKIYAHYQYELEDEASGDRTVNFVACASGEFTKNDFLSFDWNNGEPTAKVYTMTKSDPYPQANLRCAAAWAFDSGESNDKFEYYDVRKNIVQQGDSVEYYVKQGTIRGVVTAIKYNGVEVELDKHPEYGHNLDGKYSIVLSQDDFIKNKISVF